MRAATHPFVFTGCVELRQALGLLALDERELLDRVREVPPDSIFFHTHGYFLRHRRATTAYGNDFARWAAVEAHDLVLAERLAVVEPFSFPTLDGLREELVTILHDHLRGVDAVVRLPFARGFHFQQSHVVEVPLGPHVNTLAEFRDGLAAVDPSAIYLHMVEARARRGHELGGHRGRRLLLRDGAGAPGGARGRRAGAHGGRPRALRRDEQDEREETRPPRRPGVHPRRSARQPGDGARRRALGLALSLRLRGAAARRLVVLPDAR